MIRCLVLVAAMVTSALGVFVPPQEGGAPFRRDKLPVDVSTMTGLSQQLVTLVGSADGDAPADERTRAQMIALALALDPANRQARDLIETMEEGEQADSPDREEFKTALSRSWHLLGWLEQPEAGADGQALANCLVDVLVRVDPHHPSAGGRGAGERGQWNGWVADLAAFQPKAPEPVEPEPEPEPEKPTDATLVLNEASVRVPLWVTEERKPEPELRIVPLQVKAWIQKEASEGGNGEALRNPKRLRISGPERGPGRGDHWIAERLIAPLEARHGSLPDHLVFRFSIADELRFHPDNHEAATGAMLVAADTLFSGDEHSGIVLAELGDDGTIGVPTGFWNTLRTLADSRGGTLVLPEEALNYLPSLLTLDKPEFFFDYEVLVAPDASTLVDLAAADPPERVVEARAAFDAVRAARGTRSLGGFVGYDSTRERLGQVVELVPEHASARMLALRGTSQWPRQLNREIYAREIRASLHPIQLIYQKPWEQIRLDDFKLADEACREALRKLEKVHGSMQDREDLYDTAMNTVKTIGSVETALRRVEEDYEIRRAVLPTLKSYVQTMKLLTAAIGDGDDYTIPFEKRWEDD
ncbi:hypothetical protein [Haloferula sp. A504]|uniref:hypothetical protein n=1 Tax=Haloferula sp. A504 TaxID=3373601 RepID=UPI0031C8AEF6|nr:hypothetical protein [Verrucomicrobiaceae bacterium E54]